MSEKERIPLLTEKAKKGDTGAFEELYTIFESRLYYFCLHLLNDEQEAVSVTRDTFVYAWKNSSSMPTTQTFYQWLCGNAFYFAQNTRAARRGVAFTIQPGDGNDPFYDTMVKTKLPSQEPSVKRSDLNAVSNLLASLPDSERVCILLHDYAGFGVEGTASLAGCAEDTVKCHVYNGRNALRDGLDNREPGAGTTFYPFLPRLLKTCGKNCPVPPGVVEGVRSILAGKQEESVYASSIPEVPDASGKPDRGKLITVICIILGVIVLAGGIYLVWLFVNRFDPSAGPAHASSAVPSETESQVSAAPSTPSAESGTESAEPSAPVQSAEPSEDASEPSVPPVESSAPVESSETSAGQESSAPPAVRTGTTTDNLRLRSSPDTTKNNILTTIPAGSKITIIGEERDASGTLWYHATYLTYDGYCSSDYVVAS